MKFGVDLITIERFVGGFSYLFLPLFVKGHEMQCLISRTFVRCGELLLYVGTWKRITSLLIIGRKYEAKYC